MVPVRHADQTAAGRQINWIDAQTVFHFTPFLSVETAEVFWYSRVRSAEFCRVGLIDN